MQVSRDVWGDPNAWKQKQQTDPETLASLIGLALVEHEERSETRQLMRAFMERRRG